MPAWPVAFLFRAICVYVIFLHFVLNMAFFFSPSPPVIFFLLLRATKNRKNILKTTISRSYFCLDSKSVKLWPVTNRPSEAFCLCGTWTYDGYIFKVDFLSIHSSHSVVLNLFVNSSTITFVPVTSFSIANRCKEHRDRTFKRINKRSKSFLWLFSYFDIIEIREIFPILFWSGQRRSGIQSSSPHKSFSFSKFIFQEIGMYNRDKYWK